MEKGGGGGLTGAVATEDFAAEIVEVGELVNVRPLLGGAGGLVEVFHDLGAERGLDLGVGRQTINSPGRVAGRGFMAGDEEGEELSSCQYLYIPCHGTTTNLVDNILLIQHITLHLVDPPPLLDHDGQQIAAAAGKLHGRKRLVLFVGAVNVDDALADALEQQLPDLLGGADVAEVGLERDPATDRHLRVDEADEGAQGGWLEDALEALEEAGTPNISPVLPPEKTRLTQS